MLHYARSLFLDIYYIYIDIIFSCSLNSMAFPAKYSVYNILYAMTFTHTHINNNIRLLRKI